MLITKLNNIFLKKLHKRDEMNNLLIAILHSSPISSHIITDEIMDEYRYLNFAQHADLLKLHAFCDKLRDLLKHCPTPKNR